MNREPERDQELSEALRQLEGGATLNDADWNRLRAGIHARAARFFTRPAAPLTWWETMAGWARAAVPLAAAAGVFLVFLMLQETGLGTSMSPQRDAGDLESGELAFLVSGDVQVQDAVGDIVGPSDPSSLAESVMEGT
ncbi:MAG: hypothetical protein ACRENN_10615, partial [Candidatus Eiseniibacteriota bacterium]